MYAMVRNQFFDAVKQGDANTAKQIYVARADHYLEEPLFIDEVTPGMLATLEEAQIPATVLEFWAEMTGQYGPLEGWAFQVDYAPAPETLTL